ncbi:TetR/AcrR family transcriptional regulator [Paenibacillus xanthanilyticus]|uniref:TetR/AcrR family transcriptional regulator n=1 Tax=Paenibacillus xanthanilyticus TaxID=1783531 RepID=A0ABV8JY13_9BACL
MSSRKQMLLDTALSLFIEQGYAGTTIQMILDRSGVSKGTFYKFFASKEECFLAILEQRLQEDLHIRKSLEANVYASDFELLADQIAVPMASPDKERTWSLFWAGFYSGEVRAADLGRVQLNWLADRLASLYGEAVRPYAYEGAVLFYGMLHQMANTWRNFDRPDPDWKAAVPKVLRHIGLVLNAMRERGEHVFDLPTLSRMSLGEYPRRPDKEALTEELRAFNRSVQRSKAPVKAKELTKGLLATMETETLNVSLLEAVLHAFERSFASEELSREAGRIAQGCWWYLEQVKHE